ncbi:MAG: efflux RND transporter permease subunit [Gammaproteobacteria bacterium]|nr:efflux RND transporter permease subunit [Gammaproteobacteria bacterium]
MTETKSRRLRDLKGVLSLPVLRPVATAMLFLAIVILGLVGMDKMPIELFPAIEGNAIFVQFSKQNSTAETIEREILQPLTARSSGLPGLTKSSAEISGSYGHLQLMFEVGTDLKMREYELSQIANQLQREFDRGTASISVNLLGGTESFSQLVMQLRVIGDRSIDDLYNLAVDEIAPRLASVPGVARAETQGGSTRQLTVTVDPRRATGLGVTNSQIAAALRNNMAQSQYVGDLEDSDGRTHVHVDAQARSVNQLDQTRISRTSPVRIANVADVELGYSVGQTLFRHNSQPAVQMVLYQEQGANLIRVGQALKKRIAEVNREILSLGISVFVDINLAESIDNQLTRLFNLGMIGFAIALVVLFLFLRQWRAVAVVGIAVPVSVITALALLYLAGYSLNLLSISGLAMAVGLLVDNSVVVYEAILRGVERGLNARAAAALGLKRTARAIAAASITTAVVFLPVALIAFDDPVAKQLLTIIAVSVVFPVFASLLVAMGLVPLLAHSLAAPGALKRMQALREKRALQGGYIEPERAKVLLSGLTCNALRKPAPWIAGSLLVVIVSLVFTIPQLSFGGIQRDPNEADTLDIPVELSHKITTDLQEIAGKVAGVEHEILNLETVDFVQTRISRQSINFHIHFVDIKERPKGFKVAEIREFINDIIDERILDIRGYGSYGYRNYSFTAGRPLGGNPSEVVLSGPDSGKLMEFAKNVAEQLKSVNHIQTALAQVSESNPEIWVEPNQSALVALGLTVSETLPFLNWVSDRGQTQSLPYMTSSGREIPVVIEREGARDRDRSSRDLERLQVLTSRGIRPVSELATIRKVDNPPTIVHKNGRRQITVQYTLASSVPEAGRERNKIEEDIEEFIRTLPRPEGYVIDVPDDSSTTDAAQKLLFPVLLLLFLVLALTFESLILPPLVLLTIPLTLVGALWGLVLTGTPFADMALAGLLVLAGLMVNPAILLVDRMQQLSRAGFSRGAAALGAVKERTRPVLMTTATTIAALFPLAISTGRENEIWPPFAVVVMGGLVSVAILTLIVIPVGYVLLKRLDSAFGRLGPWLVVVWAVLVVGIMYPLIGFGILNGLLWQIVCTLLVAGALFGLLYLIFRREEIPKPEMDDGPPRLEVKFLKKIYGLPGAFRKTLNAQKQFIAKVREVGGKVYTRETTLVRGLVYLILAVGTAAIGYINTADHWKLVWWLVASGFLARIMIEIRKFRGHVESDGTHKRGGIEGLLVLLLPWFAIASFVYLEIYRPTTLDDTGANWFWPILASIVLFLGQCIRRNAVRQVRGELESKVSRGFMKYPRTWYRRFTKRIGGLDLPANEISALTSVSFSAEQGMIGILGPNGAGKTTLLRQLAGMIESSGGTVHLGNVPLPKIQRTLAQWVGYLPQDAGLPLSLTPREYLDYYAALYDIDPAIRNKRVVELLEEVGLKDKVNDKIKSLSGGMRQRVAVARTLLRLPPIIIVDEPTVGLDPRERIRFRNLLSRLAESRVVLFSTHVVEDVAISCDRVLVLAKSRLRFDGSPAKLAEAAEGKVWEIHHDHEIDVTLPTDTILVEQTPTTAGGVIQRVVSKQQPEDEAKPITARPEDGYLWLLATS